MDDYGVECLVDAIVRQACYDYIRALKKLEKDCCDEEADKTKRECERFFRSEWFYGITGVKPKDFMRLLERRIYEMPLRKSSVH